MALHARQVAIAAGAPQDRVAAVAEQMIAEGKIHIQRALEIVENWRVK
jgi:hydroxymethylglutaryl-CoA reductase